MPRQHGTTGIQALSSAPAVGPEGATYWDSVNNKLYVSVDGAWVQYAPVPPGGGVGQVLTKDTGLDYMASWQNPAGGTPSGAAGGDLSGTYPNPQIAAGVITDADVAAANKDGAVGTASMRTLGTGAQQAAVGSHGHALTDAGITGTLAVAKGGTGSATALTQGGVKYGVTTTAEGTSAAGSSGQLMVSGGTGAPTWAAADLTTMPQSWVKESVTCATVGNITMSGVAVNVDNIVPSAGQRVLVKDQVLPAENGIYVAAAGAWARATDAALSSHIAGATVNVDNGTVNGGYVFTNSFKTTDTLGTTAMPWAKVTASGERWLAPVRVTTAESSGSITLSGLQSVDSVSLVAGDRVLVTHQSTNGQNGIYVVSAGAWTRAGDADTAAKVAQGTNVLVLEGTYGKLKTMTQSIPVVTLGTDSQEWIVLSFAEVAGMFSFPSPRAQGHFVYALNQRDFAVWDGTSWIHTNLVWLCTSTTRPGFVEPGTMIYETDTGLSYIWYGGAWVGFGQEVAVQAAQPTAAGYDLWVDTDDYGTAIAATPLGTVGYAEITANSVTVNSTAVTDVAGLSVTFTTDGTRRFKITGQALFQSTVSLDRPGYIFREGSTQLNVTTFTVGSANGSYGINLHHVVVPTAGTHTYKVSITRSSGSGVMNIVAGVGQPAFLLVEDIGV